MKSLIWIASFCVTAAAAAWLGYSYGANAETESIDIDQATESVEPASIRGQGKLQPAAGTIQIMAQPGERVDQLMVKVGDDVESDSPLVALASREARSLELELAKIQKTDTLKKAEIQVTANRFKLKAAEIAVREALSAKSKILNQNQAIEVLRKNRDAAKRALDKLKTMQTDPVTSDLVGQNEIDTQQSLLDRLESQIQTAEGEVSLASESAERAQVLAENQLELAKYNIQSSQALVPTESLDFAIELAQMAFDATLIKSPIAGKILDITIHRGDTVATRPLMLIGDTAQMACIAEITDSQLRDVKMGSAVELTSDAFSETLHGTVVEIGTMIGPPSMSNPNPYARVDRRTGKVKIKIHGDGTRTASQFVNLQVQVKILRTKSSKSLVEQEPEIAETTRDSAQETLEMID